MLNLSAIAASVAQGISAQFGAPYVSGQVVDLGDPIMAGGSIVTPAIPTRRDCLVQIATASQAMRGADGFADGDVRFLILCDTLVGPLDTDAAVFVAAGQNSGSWVVSSIERDSLGIRWEGRGRRASNIAAYAPPGWALDLSNPSNAIHVGDLL